MKILVCVKRVINPYAKIVPTSNNENIKAHSLRYAINPFDEIAIEEAVRLKEQNNAEVVIIGIGDTQYQDTLRKALAMGADRAILVETEQELNTLDVANVIAKIAQEEQVSLILMGKQSTDGDHSHVGPMLAGMLDWPQATFISDIKLIEEKALVTREIDAGLEQIEVTLPAVITCDLRLNEPRYPSVPNIVKAKKKEIKIVSFAEMDIVCNSNYKILRYDLPKERSQGEMVTDVDELISKLNLTDRVAN